LKRLAAAGAEGAIIGTALYEGRLNLKEVVAAC
jgi:phosphoribosylformimino-5-aminoimidazole carboxamide ribonucleotide (ProFAR) isomerase